MWITFKRSAKDWARYVPGYFLEINPTWYRYGLGFYDAAPDLMARFRQQIDEDPKSFLKAVAWFAKQDIFTLEGETYKRPSARTSPSRSAPGTAQELLPDLQPQDRRRDPVAGVRRSTHGALRPGRPALSLHPPLGDAGPRGPPST